MNKQCTMEIGQAQEELRALCEQRDSASDFKKHMDTIRTVLQAAERDAACGVINKDFVDKYIDKIYATMDDENTMHLQIKIFTGETTDKYLLNLRSRTGHTFKNVFPIRTARFTRNDRTTVGHTVEVRYIATLTV